MKLTHFFVVFVLIGTIIFIIAAATTCKKQQPKQLKQRLWQIPAALIPELSELIIAFEKESKTINNFDFYDFYKNDKEATFLQQSAMQHPGSHYKIFKEYENNKRKAIDFDSKWILSMGKLMHRKFKDPVERQKWFRKLDGIRISGNFYYPPGGWREWHTNEFDTPGWRLYYVKIKEANKSWFNYIDPHSGKFVQTADKDGHFNLFDLHSQDGLLWHSVYSDTHRFSLGLHITNEMAQSLISRLKNGPTKPIGRGFDELGDEVVD